MFQSTIYFHQTELIIKKIIYYEEKKEIHYEQKLISIFIFLLQILVCVIDLVYPQKYPRPDLILTPGQRKKDKDSDDELVSQFIFMHLQFES